MRYLKIESKKKDKAINQTLGKFDRKCFAEKKALPNKDFLLAQVFFCKKKKCIDVSGMFDGEEAKKKGFIIGEYDKI